MEIKKIGIVGQGALGVMYGNYLKKRMGNENVFFIADEGRVNRYRSADMVCNGEACGFSYRSPAEVVTADLIIFAVKFMGMESALETVKPFVGENTLFLSVLNGISSEGMIEEAYGAPYSLIQKEGEARTMMIEAMREVLRVADTQDVDLSEADISYWLNLLATLNPDGHTSMCQDVLAGRPTEVELFAGTMLKIAEEEGLSLPVNAFLYERLKELETAED